MTNDDTTLPERDPLIDPRAGDVVYSETRGIRHVTAVGLARMPLPGTQTLARDISYVSDKRKGVHTCWISAWQDWCHRNKATVLKQVPA